MRDTQEIGRDVIVGTPNWPALLEVNKETFVAEFAARAQFVSLYPPSLTPAQYVEALASNTGDPLNPSAGGALTQGARDQLAAELTAGTKTRAQVLRAVAENAENRRRQSNKAFVLMQYFGYMRRGPNESPDTNFNGYNFWLSQLTNST